jgi:hypothetical protein
LKKAEEARKAKDAEAKAPKGGTPGGEV